MLLPLLFYFSRSCRVRALLILMIMDIIIMNDFFFPKKFIYIYIFTPPFFFCSALFDLRDRIFFLFFFFLNAGDFIAYCYYYSISGSHFFFLYGAIIMRIGIHFSSSSQNSFYLSYAYSVFVICRCSEQLLLLLVCILSPFTLGLLQAHC